MRTRCPFGILLLALTILASAEKLRGQDDRSVCIFSEDFNGPGIPSGWDIGVPVEQLDANGNGTGNFVPPWRIGDAGEANANGYFPAPGTGFGDLFIMANDDAPPCDCDLTEIYLTSPSLDLVGSTGTLLEFQLFFDGAFGADSAWLDGSPDGSTWTRLRELPADPSAWSTVYTDLSALDGNVGARFRIGWTDKGNWVGGIAIDDLCIRSRSARDLVLDEGFLADVGRDPFDQTVRSLEYTEIPGTQYGTLEVGGAVRNLGTLALFQVWLEAEVFQNGVSQGMFFSDTLALLSALGSDTLEIETGWSAPSSGIVTVDYRARHTGTEDAPGDETASRTHRVTGPGGPSEGNSAMSLYSGTTGPLITGPASGFWSGVRLEPVSDGTLHHVSFQLGQGTQEGATVVGLLLNSSLDVIDSTQVLELDAQAIDAGLWGDRTYLNFDPPVPFQAGQDLILAVAQAADSGALVLTSAGTGPIGHALFREAGNGPWEFPLHTPAIAGHLDQVPLSMEEGSTEGIRLGLFPNPAAEWVLISSPDELRNLEFYDGQGRLVERVSWPVGSRSRGVIHLSVSDWPSGVYTLRAWNDAGESYGQRLIIE
ncbi:MAG: T9SS type A sorting domain-containing protein [Flavobacteriales bacterium]|nr:T9SS type A sorting domain-containing protein [Flavobacteriales bacterium]